MVLVITFTITIDNNLLNLLHPDFINLIIYQLDNNMVNVLLDYILFWLEGYYDPILHRFDPLFSVFLGPYSEIGIRATQVLLERGVIIDRIIDYTQTFFLPACLFNHQPLIERNNSNTVYYDNFENDFENDFENYISDEDFMYDRYEWTGSDNIVNDSDWEYNSP